MAKNEILVLAEEALRAKKINDSAFTNLTNWVQASFLPEWATEALGELAHSGEWGEINDRFFQELAFGTGGIRGLTIGRVMSPTETGTPSAEGTPAHAAIGPNALNDITLARATAGLFRYVAAWLARQSPRPSPRKPVLVIAHDVRHFSRHFSELAASVWARLGGETYLFDGPRSTPQLSFTVRHLKADAGVVITASHNPPQYNGFKCYFNDGAQVVPPHDVAIINAVASIGLSEIGELVREKNLSKIRAVPAQAEAAYLERLADNVLAPDLFAKSAPTLVYTNLHGTGDVMIPAALKRFGVQPILVEAQRPHDPRFPTVASPNPENAAAFALAIDAAKAASADLAIATDPDDDRVGAAVRERDGSYRVLTGNQIGAALTAYRIAQMKAAGVLPAAGTRRAVLVKTFVTSPFQDAIAAAEGIRVVNVPTGFKWIGAKLGKYQRQVEAALAAVGNAPAAGDYDKLPWKTRAKLHLENASLFVFGGEESMGYLGTDATRDKDGNASTLMLSELAAWLKNTGKTFSEFFDEITFRVGAAFAEDLLNIQYEAGAVGLKRIRAILKSFRQNPPAEVAGSVVTDFRDFGQQDLFDEDGDPVPKEDFYFFTLADGRQFAVRGSGTEPKIKYYLFARARVVTPAEIPAVRQHLAASLKSLENFLQADADQRSNEA